jgi:hypothetical protein
MLSETVYRAVGRGRKNIRQRLSIISIADALAFSRCAYLTCLGTVTFSSCSWRLPAKFARRLESFSDVTVELLACMRILLTLDSLIPVRLVFVEDASHMLIEPVELIAGREGELLNFRLRNVKCT